MTAKCRVLSLSGGGVRGLFIAGFLAKIEEITGKSIRSHFDLIAGTSTGGLIAIALAFGRTPEEIVKHYHKWLPSIFRPSMLGKLRQYRSCKYSNIALQNAIWELVPKEKLLFEASNRLCIPAVHYNDMWPTVLKTRHQADYVRDPLLPAWQVGMATSAAPTYFPAFKCQDGRSFWDGGLWANDPALVGTLEAMGVLGHNPGDIEVLSVGTTRTTKKPDAALADSGAKGLLRMTNPVLLGYVSRLSELSALEMARLFLRSRDAVVHVNDTLEGDGFVLDDASPATLAELERRGRMQATYMTAKDRERFFSTTVDPFTPVPWPSTGAISEG